MAWERGYMITPTRTYAIYIRTLIHIPAPLPCEVKLNYGDVKSVPTIK